MEGFEGEASRKSRGNSSLVVCTLVANLFLLREVQEVCRPATPLHNMFSELRALYF